MKSERGREDDTPEAREPGEGLVSAVDRIIGRGKLLDACDLAILSLDRELRIRHYTQAVRDLIDIRPGDAGRPLADLSLEFDDPELLDEAREVLAGEVPRSQEVEHASGRTYLRRLFPYRTEGDRIDGVVVSFSDVTALKEVEREFERIADELEGKAERGADDLALLLDLAELANRSKGVTEALEAALGRICQRNGWQIGHAYLVGEDGRAVSTDLWVECDGGWDVDLLRKRLDGASFAPGEGLVGEVLSSGEPRWEVDPADSETYRGAAAELGTVLLFPVLVGERVAGLLEFFSPHQDEPTPRRIELMANVGVHLGRVLEREEMERWKDELAMAEQERIGIELHDTVGQHLTGIGMALFALGKRLEEEGSDHTELAMQLVERLESAKGDLSLVSRTLLPGRIPAGRLRPVLEDLLGHYRELYPGEYTVEMDSAGGELDEAESTYLHRVAREALHNAVRHGAPEHISIRFQRSDEQLLLEIEDDGVGMESVPANQQGVGLSIMKRACAMIGGELEIDSTLGGGTRVACRVGRGKGGGASSFGGG